MNKSRMIILASHFKELYSKQIRGKSGKFWGFGDFLTAKSLRVETRQ